MELRALKAAMNTALRWKLLETNPFASVQQVRVVETVPTYFTKADFEKLLATVKENWLKEMIVFAVSTGMRQGEMLNLRWLDVNLGRKLIHIQSNATFKTKAGKRRTIPMSDVVHSVLSGKAASAKGEYVFTRKGRRIADSYLTHQFKAAVRAAGLSDELHWHSLRHTHASYLVQAGVPILAVSKLLGHSSVRVTEKHYAVLAPESLHEEVNKISLN
jgi:integrase